MDRETRMHIETKWMEKKKKTGYNVVGGGITEPNHAGVKMARKFSRLTAFENIDLTCNYWKKVGVGV